MADFPTREKSSSEYSGSQAPDVQDAANDSRPDHRMIPGGDPSRATAMYGMESVDQDDNATRNAGHPDLSEPRDR